MSWIDTKQSDGETWVMLELWGMSLSAGPIWPGVVTLDRILSMGQIEFGISTKCKQMTYAKIEMFDHLTVFKQMTV